MTPHDRASVSDTDRLRRQMTFLWAAVAVLALALSGAVIRVATTTPVAPDVLTVERLEIVEPDGSPALVLANSQRPAVATVDGHVLMEGQEEERRGVPSIIFFDGKGDEVGGMLFGVRETPGGYLRGPAPVPGCERSGSDRGPCALSGSGGIDIGPHDHRPAGPFTARLPCTTGPFRRRVERATAGRDGAASRGWKGGSAAGAVRNQPRLFRFDSWRRGRSHAPGWRGASTHRHRSAKRRRTVHPRSGCGGGGRPPIA